MNNMKIIYMECTLALLPIEVAKQILSSGVPKDIEGNRYVVIYEPT